MAYIASRSRYATTGLVYDLHHIAISVLHQKSIASPTTIRRHLHHMDHPLDLQCHPLQYVCSSFEVEGEGERELIVEVVVEMVGEVMVEMVGEVVVHLRRHCLLRYPPPPPPHTYPSPKIFIPPHTDTSSSIPQTLTHLYHIRCRQS